LCIGRKTHWISSSTDLSTKKTQVRFESITVAVRRVLLIGCPGTSRTDINQNLAAYFNWVPINTGDLLRKEVQKKTDNGKRI
jgi:SpoVK/Ycf46/Vps4 family AAA+-type ATPase